MKAKKSGFKKYIIFVALSILIIGSAISYMPEIFMDQGLYSRIHQLILVAMVGITALTNKFDNLLQNKFLNKILFPFAIFSLLLVLFYALGFRITSEDFMQIAIIYISVWIGHELCFSEKGITYLLFIYAIVAILLGYSSLNTYLGEVSLEGNMYAIEGKNQIGAIISTGAFFMCYVTQTTSIKKVRITAFILTLILFALLIYVRCRTALLAFILVALYSIVKLSSKKNLTTYTFIGLLILLIFSQQIFGTLQEAFIGDRGTANMDELSSNRIERNIQGIDFFADNLLIGEMKAHSGIEIIHNYLLNRFVRYGIWAISLAICYFVFFIKIIRQTFFPQKFSFYDIGFFVLIIPFICSMLEPDAPFGPGTVQAFLYIMFGYSLRNSLNK